MIQSFSAKPSNHKPLSAATDSMIVRIVWRKELEEMLFEKSAPLSYEEATGYLKDQKNVVFFFNNKLQNSLNGLEECLSRASSKCDHWIVSKNKTNFCYLRLFRVIKKNKEHKAFTSQLKKGEKGIFLDLLLSSGEFIERGHLCLVVYNFLKTHYFHFDRVFSHLETTPNHTLSLFQGIGFRPAPEDADLSNAMTKQVMILKKV